MNRKNLLYLLLLSLSLASCFRATMPPGPNMAGGGYENAGYQFFQWQEGLRIMVWHEAVTESSCDSTVGYGVDTNFAQCRLLTESSIEYTWDIATKDGRTANFMLNGQPYDVADGNLFLITIENGFPDVQQLPRDLSGVEANHESITQFGLADADISQFIEAASPDN